LWEGVECECGAILFIDNTGKAEWTRGDPNYKKDQVDEIKEVPDEWT
jgi:hypothetical protein